MDCWCPLSTQMFTKLFEASNSDRHTSGTFCSPLVQLSLGEKLPLMFCTHIGWRPQDIYSSCIPPYHSPYTLVFMCFAWTQYDVQSLLQPLTAEELHVPAWAPFAVNCSNVQQCVVPPAAV